MVRRPWEWVSKPEADREYLALLSHLPLKRYRTIPSFMRLSGAIQGQLMNTRGLIGFSFYADILGKRFWTLSVWEGKEALRGFVLQEPHQGTMAAMRPHMQGQYFVRWGIKGFEVPPTWEDALRRSPSG